MDDPDFFGDCNAEQELVYGMFGVHDELVTGTFELFSKHYPNAIHFEGTHYMDDSVFLKSVLPVIERIDDIQEKRSKPVMLISLTDTLLDMKNGEAHGLSVEDMEPYGSAVKAFAALSRHYTPYILISNSFNEPERLPALYRWVERNWVCRHGTESLSRTERIWFSATISLTVILKGLRQRTLWVPSCISARNRSRRGKRYLPI